MNASAARVAALAVVILAGLAVAVSGQPAAAPDSAAGVTETRPLSLPAGDSEAGAPERSPAGYLLRALGSLLLVVGLIWLAYFALRRFHPSLRTPSQQGLIEVLDSRSLGSDRSIHAVKFAGRVFLIAMTASAVTCVSECPEEHANRLRHEGATTDSDDAAAT